MLRIVELGEYRWFVEINQDKVIVWRGEKYILPAGKIKKWVDAGLLDIVDATMILRIYGLPDKEIKALLPMI